MSAISEISFPSIASSASTFISELLSILCALVPGCTFFVSIVKSTFYVPLFGTVSRMPSPASRCSKRLLLKFEVKFGGGTAGTKSFLVDCMPIGYRLASSVFLVVGCWKGLENLSELMGSELFSLRSLLKRSILSNYRKPKGIRGTAGNGRRYTGQLMDDSRAFSKSPFSLNFHTIPVCPFLQFRILSVFPVPQFIQT